MRVIFLLIRAFVLALYIYVLALLYLAVHRVKTNPFLLVSTSMSLKVERYETDRNVYGIKIYIYVIYRLGGPYREKL